MERLGETWDELLTVGLLGTDRRDPPDLPVGPLADTVADTQRTTPQGRLLASVAATVVARRCGATPAQPCALLMAPEPDRRPLLPPAAVARWQAIVSEWPVLEAEWLAVAAASGWRPAPDLLVALLRRHERSPLLAKAVLTWGGPQAAWLVDQVAELQPADIRAPLPTALRPLPVPVEIEPLLEGDAATLAAALTGGLSTGVFRWSHRAVLLNVVARIKPTSLTVVGSALRNSRQGLDQAGDDAAPLALWEALIELAAVRVEMLTDLQPPDPETSA